MLYSAAISALIGMTLVRPSWPTEAWEKLTTKSVSFEFIDHGICDERTAYDPDQVFIESDRKTVHAWISINCSARLGKPMVTERKNLLRLSVTSEFPYDGSDMVASCNCSHKATFHMSRAVTSGQKVVLYADEKETGQTVAP